MAMVNVVTVCLYVGLWFKLIGAATWRWDAFIA